MLEINNACCFFGHRDAPEYILPEIKSNIKTLITECGVTTFYVGNQRVNLFLQSQKFQLNYQIVPGKLKYITIGSTSG